MIRVLLVDDQPMVRAGLGLILRSQPDIRVVAERGDGGDVVQAVAQHTPDVVCMDVRMPGVDGVEATRRLRAADGPPVCILTTFDDDHVLWSAVDAGAAGFELKSATAENLIEAIRTVAAGGTWIDGTLLGPILDSYRRSVRPLTHYDDRLDALTGRELDVLRLMARGASNQEIADRLFLAETTVKTHVGGLFTKLGARDRAAAIVFAYDAGLVQPRR
ncbi:two component transcriptional regulator, LuxR family [Promicromonospora umidemergens]|uniref:Response regulator transcription factor n=1 Tax=Promicromonospora umidemergens TaxID=629679 RepID=A0ABP8YAZ9_9MICO|nr:response regulator transcription factor [Promicromonospora umidemergens]MCP2282239.1 two component transcriptional regulator, LuxR family [Promicromonospora umidemergens]